MVTPNAFNSFEGKITIFVSFEIRVGLYYNYCKCKKFSKIRNTINFCLNK